jgi:Phage integrase, N-terminal SAM-like domain
MSQLAPRLQVLSTHAPHAQPKLLDRVRAAIRARHYSIRTEEAYVGWIRRFILFHNKRHPAEMGESEINQFLTHLAVREAVAASTQNQALSAILFLYQEVLERDLDRIDGVVRAKKPARLPVVLTRDEVRALLGRMSGTPKLVGLLLYGAGLRLNQTPTAIESATDTFLFGEFDAAPNRQKRVQFLKAFSTTSNRLGCNTTAKDVQNCTDRKGKSM